MEVHILAQCEVLQVFGWNITSLLKTPYFSPQLMLLFHFLDKSHFEFIDELMLLFLYLCNVAQHVLEEDKLKNETLYLEAFSVSEVARPRVYCLYCGR